MINYLMDTEPGILSIRQYLLDFQDRLCQALANQEELQSFQEDSWQHDEGGGGRTRVLANGNVFEKGGVNFSHIQSKKLPTAATVKRPHLANCPFEVLGVSVVIHPLNPYVPTSHMNLRFFRTQQDHDAVWWFGGGFDLTPYYPFLEDCIEWHRVAADLCRPFGETVYTRFKNWCDEYFYLPHRKETRGVGGLFFDDLNIWSFEQCFAFIQAVGEGFLQTYPAIVAKRKHTVYGHTEREFQLYRRGRYAEFNLLYDRGTIFGLQSGGRVESILMSLPPITKWEYNRRSTVPAEQNLIHFLRPVNWLDLKSGDDLAQIAMTD